MVWTPDDTPKGNKRRRSAAEKLEAAGRLIRENPIRAQVVFSRAGPMGTVTPQDDGTWTGCRYGPGYPDDTIQTADEDEAIDYVLNGQELTDGPNIHPALEQMWRKQEEESERYEAEMAARAAARAAKRKS
ncbi:hypothetical protein GGR39_003298 [Novosphingobium fluoreni]|uniref:Uncharacterized protein n=1 Tax=Novosphingobium fluoreni TaxID=1391222 RepID=A0A7W6C325_9SPHN|nr:hypothetical protein [Novosphingobium fluoreni]MBB3941617.1 hypothetical protein [Novosphingobium fluoreni]